MISKGMRTRMRRWSSPTENRPARPNNRALLPAAEDFHLRSVPANPRVAVKVDASRIRKSERDERVDITRVLTPPKSYMGGFTRPTTLRHTHWYPGGYYTDSQRTYEPPVAEAYEPHTVFLLESRYPVRHESHMFDCNEFAVGVCREGDFPAVLNKFNSNECPDRYLKFMDDAHWPSSMHAKQRRASVPAELLSSTLPSRGATQRRAYHASASRWASESDSDASKLPRNTPEERAQIPGSSWSRPPKPSQDADDDVVPIYYIERKRQRDTIAERKEEEGGLMAELSAGILSEGVAAQTKVLPEKIPVEVKMPDGSVVHPSGFEPPTPETDFHPMASKVATEEDPLLTTIKVTWDEALAPAEEALDAATTVADVSSSSSPKLVRSFHSSAVARASASALPLDVSPLPPNAVASSSKVTMEDFIRVPRSQYLRTLKESPFWRPILSLTFTTRPLAISIARLSRSLERGLPFYVTVPEADRAATKPFSEHLRDLRLARMQSLTSQLTQQLQGARGGIPGLRFDAAQKGRGVQGEGLAEPVAPEHRTVKVGVADWHALSSQLKARFERDAAKNDASDVTQVFGIDEKGMRTDGVAWAEPSELHEMSAGSLERLALTKEEWGSLTSAERKVKVDAFAKVHGYELAQAMCQKHRSVIYP
ncbi:hypothetical protein EIP91_007102 [Steccherinum ochraceum]|uniref:Uncharacterized protein n=1 Tax=Steccherinum ochraceum TaxID=92696 RepID=A0A4R0R7A3_9APHY|nr:hypothetical protein EIP91_007102 [Steccherinum ochraceum]